MVSLARNYGNTALLGFVGEYANNIPLTEYWCIYEAGSPMSLTGIEFEWQLRSCRGDSADKVFSTDSGMQITTAENENGDTVPAILLNALDVTSLNGDYISDVIMKDATGKYTLLAHGTATFFNDPVVPTI